MVRENAKDSVNFKSGDSNLGNVKIRWRPGGWEMGNSQAGVVVWVSLRFALVCAGIPSKCKAQGCDLVAWYGTTKRVACSLHKSEGMGDLKHPKCEHGRRRNVCRDCGGSGVCEHNHRRNTCRECGGSQVCEHNRRKDICKECEGPGMCDHGRQKAHCLIG